MTSPSNSDVQNLLPVQAYFNLDGSFNTFIGQGEPFYATINPSQSGLNITNSTINSTTIGATTPSTGVFTNISTTTGTISTTPFNNNDITNKAYVDAVSQGLSFKQPANVATTVNITLSGLQTIDGITVVAGNRVLVKNQTNQADNGIYLASATAWSRAPDANTWDEYLAAYLFILEGTVWGGSAWVCTVVPGGTLGVTPITFTQFSNTALYTAGTGLTLNNFVFSITPVGTASTYGSATQTPVFTTNASGQVTAVTNTTITPAVGSITGLGTGVATALAVNTGSAGSFVINGGALGTPSSGTLTNCTFPTLNQNTTGYAAGLAGGALGSLPYQSAVNTTTFLAAGSNGQVLTLAAGVPSWATPTTGTVTSVSGTGTVSGISLSGTVTSSGSLTLGGTLDLSAPPAIGGTTANTITGTTITASTKFVGPYFDAASSAGGALRNASGTACLQWGGGGGANLTVDVSANLNGANAQIDISPTGTGHVHINPTGNGSIEMNPTSAGVMNNMVIGGTTPLAGTFTTLRVNSTISLNGSTGTANYLLQSNGASAPSWVNPATLTVSAASTATTATNATNVGIVDDTTTATTVYPVWANSTSGNQALETSSTKLSFVPSTGTLTATAFSGLASSATNIAGGVANQIHYQTGVGATGFITAPSNNTYLTYTTGGGFAWSTIAGGGSVTSVAQSFTGGLISVAGSPITTSGTLALTVAGTSGGIPYFSSASTWASSAALTANALMIGGGAGVAPSTITTGTGVVTALGVAVGSAGAFVTNGGALGTPSSGVATNLTGTASGLSIGGNAATATSATSATNATNATNVAIVNDVATATTVYPVWSNGTSGNQALEVSNTKLSFVPSTGVLSANGVALTGNTGTVTSVGGTGTVNGITLTGTVTTSGNLTLGGTLGSIANSQLTNSSVTVTAGTGMSGGGAVALGSSVTLTNAGVTSVTAGTGISVSASTGGVTITNTAASYAGPGATVVTSTGTFTIPTGITKLKVTVVGGGGGGGGSSADINYQGGSGGGAGGAGISYLTGLTPGNTISVTIGAAGTGGAGGNNIAGSGGSTSIASGTQSITTVTATGGVGGVSTQYANARNLGTTKGGNGGSCSGATMNFGGNAGANTYKSGGNDGQQDVSGGGAGSIFGGGAPGKNTNDGNGAAGAAFGAGGGGAQFQGSSNTGGAGVAGVVIFEY